MFLIKLSPKFCSKISPDFYGCGFYMLSPVCGFSHNFIGHFNSLGNVVRLYCFGNSRVSIQWIWKRVSQSIIMEHVLCKVVDKMSQWEEAQERIQRRAKLQGETSPPFPTHYVEQAIVKGMLRSKYLRNEV